MGFFYAFKGPEIFAESQGVDIRKVRESPPTGTDLAHVNGVLSGLLHVAAKGHNIIDL